MYPSLLKDDLLLFLSFRRTSSTLNFNGPTISNLSYFTFPVVGFFPNLRPGNFNSTIYLLPFPKGSTQNEVRCYTHTKTQTLFKPRRHFWQRSKGRRITVSGARPTVDYAPFDLGWTRSSPHRPLPTVGPPGRRGVSSEKIPLTDFVPFLYNSCRVRWSCVGRCFFSVQK